MVSIALQESKDGSTGGETHTSGGESSAASGGGGGGASAGRVGVAGAAGAARGGGLCGSTSGCGIRASGGERSAAADGAGEAASRRSNHWCGQASGDGSSSILRSGSSGLAGDDRGLTGDNTEGVGLSQIVDLLRTVLADCFILTGHQWVLKRTVESEEVSATTPEVRAKADRVAKRMEVRMLNDSVGSGL